MDYGLFKRGKYWHYRFTVNNVQERGSTKTTVKPLAIEYARDLYQKLYRQGHDIGNDKVKIKDFVEYHLSLKAANTSQSWHSIKSYYLAAFVNYMLGKTALQYIKELGHRANFCCLEGYQKKLLEIMSPGSAKNHISAIGTMFNHAVKLGHINSNPLKKLDPIQGIRKNKKRFLSKDETKAVLNETKGTYFETFIRTAIYTGMRKSELINLEYEDIDIEKKLIHIRNKDDFLTKSRKERILPLHPKIVDIFPPGKKGYCYLYDGRRIHKDTVTRDFKKIVDKMGLKDVTIHTLRHTFISHCLMAGISMWEVSQWAGHSSSYITELYGHLCPDRREIDRLEI